MTGYIIDKIKRNKEALLLGMSYLERWYNFSYGEVNVKDLVMYHRTSLVKEILHH